jgi:hypothetical protein
VPDLPVSQSSGWQRDETYRVRKARYLSRTTNDIQKRTPVQFSSLDDFRRRGLGEDRPSSPTGRCVRFWRRMRRRSGRGFLLTRVIGGASSCRSLSPPCVAAGYVTARSTAGLNKLVNGSSAEADLQVFQVAFRSIRLVCKNTIPARQRSFRRRHCEAQHGGDERRGLHGGYLSNRDGPPVQIRAVGGVLREPMRCATSIISALSTTSSPRVRKSRKWRCQALREAKGLGSSISANYIFE